MVLATLGTSEPQCWRHLTASDLQCTLEHAACCLANEGGSLALLGQILA